MQKLHFSIVIDAPKEKVWDVMLSDATYRVWTTVFGSEGYFKGSWEQGADIRFLALDKENGGETGMISRIKENRLHEFVSIEHLGFQKGDVDDFSSELVKGWLPAFENYTLVEKDGSTEVQVDIDVDEAFVEEFSKAWSKGLELIKKISEGKS